MIQVHHAEASALVGVAREVGAIIADPPYSAHVHERAMSTRSPASGGPQARDLGFACLDPATLATLASMVWACPGWSVVFSDLEGLHVWRDRCPLEYVRTVPWIRWSQPQITGDRPPSGAEAIIVLHGKRKKSWAGPGNLTAFTSGADHVASHVTPKALRGADKFACEKPLDLMLMLVSWFAKPGEIVLDPCCGSGTTGLACRVLGRDALLADRDAGAASLADARVRQPLTDRDRDRVQRYIDYQEAWIEVTTSESRSALERVSRAQADVEAARSVL